MATQTAQQSNKATLRSFFKHLETGDVDGIRVLIADDVHWWAQGKGIMTKAELCENTVRNIGMTTHRLATIERLIAEDNYVHALVSTRFTFQDQRVLENKMSISVEINNGFIVDFVEYMDIDAVRSFFAG